MKTFKFYVYVEIEAESIEEAGDVLDAVGALSPDSVVFWHPESVGDDGTCCD